MKLLDDYEPECIRRVHFEYEDIDIGISKENFKNLFGKLEQPNSNINHHGVDLGLAISQNLVESLNEYIPGENIRVKSFRQGSKFYPRLLAGSFFLRSRG